MTASVALYRLWLSRDGTPPDFLAGHSLGEYSALVCSGALAFADAVKLVEARGKFMQEAVPEGQGKMAAILGLDDAAIKAACDESAQGKVVAPVNFNSPRLSALSSSIGHDREDGSAAPGSVFFIEKFDGTVIKSSLFGTMASPLYS